MLELFSYQDLTFKSSLVLGLIPENSSKFDFFRVMPSYEFLWVELKAKTIVGWQNSVLCVLGAVFDQRHSLFCSCVGEWLIPMTLKWPNFIHK